MIDRRFLEEGYRVGREWSRRFEQIVLEEAEDELLFRFRTKPLRMPHEVLSQKADEEADEGHEHFHVLVPDSLPDEAVGFLLVPLDPRFEDALSEPFSVDVFGVDGDVRHLRFQKATPEGRGE